MIMESIKAFVASGIILLGYGTTSEILFKEKKPITKTTFCMILFFSIIIGVIVIGKPEISFGITQKTFITFFVIFINKEKYQTNISESLIGSCLIYGTLLVSEILWDGVLVRNGIKMMERGIFGENPILESLIKDPIVESIFCVSITNRIIHHFQNGYQKLFDKLKQMKLDRIQLVFATSLFLISIIRIFPVNKTAMGIDLFLFVSLSIIFGNLIVYIMIERIDKEKWMGNYKYILEYAKANEGMLENYRLTAHETQNHLIILDNMIPKSNKKAHEYIASLTEEKEWKKYCFVNDLKYIPITELKGFINYKMMEMMNQNIHVQVTVSKEIENSKIKRLSRKEKEDLYNIIGVLLDNAKEGAKKSKKKEVIFQMYKEGKEIIILIANTYKGKIDVEKVGSYGYSTKGKGHGVGLHLVEMILGKSKRFTKETSLIDSYFIQKIRVK